MATKRTKFCIEIYERGEDPRLIRLTLALSL
jgi:hypothetical protein